MLKAATKVCLAAGILLLGTARGDDGPPRSSFVQPVEEAFSAALIRNEVGTQFAAHCQFVKQLFADSSGEKTFRDKTGNCRLLELEPIVASPQHALSWAEGNTRAVMEMARQRDQLPQAMRLMADLARPVKDGAVIDPEILKGYPNKLEAYQKFLEANSDEPGRNQGLFKSIHLIDQLLMRVKKDFKAAMAPLSAEEQAALRELLYPQTTGELNHGHRFADSRSGRQATDLLEKMDRTALARAAIWAAGLADPDMVGRFSQIEFPESLLHVKGVSGPVYWKKDGLHGSILVGGPEANVYQLDELEDVAVVIDLGGKDTYVEGTTTDKRPLLVVIDLTGDDTYRGAKPGIQGSGILGVSVLVDYQGDDSYSAVDVAQGSALGGIGLLIDYQGNDKYRGDRRVQGQATGGFGLLVDRVGDDDYRAAMLSQGVGGPLGIGALIDLYGTDHYYAGGKYPGGYDDTPGFGAWSQGVGVGPRGVANGGIGLILDGAGDDTYEADYFSHGGGYWFAAGVARDFAGNDQRLGATRENFDGTPRTEARFVRWGTGYGCHYSAGFVIDDAGNDMYQADFAVIGYAWDIAVAGICDLAGNDKYLTPGSGVCEAHNAAVAFLYDKSGDDEYQGGTGNTTEKTDYHPEGGSGNYTFLFDEAGDDQYGHELKNGAEQFRGWKGAVLIDRL